MEILKAHNGTWITVDTEHCEWVYGFSKGENVYIRFIESCTQGIYEIEGNVIDVIDIEFDKSIGGVKTRVLLLQHGTDYYAIPDYHILAMGNEI